MMHLALSYIITLNVTSSLFYSSREVKVAALAMECFQTSRSSTSSVFENNKLIYIHCVSKENFSVTLKGFTCISLICRDIHVSFLDSMDERRRAVVPVTVENSAVDDLFAGVRRLSLSSQTKPQEEIWTLSNNRTTLFLSLGDTFKAVARVVELA